MIDEQTLQQYAALKVQAEREAAHGRMLSPEQQQWMDSTYARAASTLTPQEQAQALAVIDSLSAQYHQYYAHQDAQRDADQMIRYQDQVTRDLTGNQLTDAHQLAPAARGEKILRRGKGGIDPTTYKDTLTGMMQSLGKEDWTDKDFNRVVNRHDELKLSRGEEAAQSYLNRTFGSEHGEAAADMVKSFDESGVGMLYELEKRRGGYDADYEDDVSPDEERRAQLVTSALKDASETPEDNFLTNDEFADNYLEREDSLGDVAAAWVQHEG